MNLRLVFLLSIILGVILSINFISAAPAQPFTSTQTGLNIESPNLYYAQIGVDHRFHVHVINETRILTNTSTTCFLHFYNQSGWDAETVPQVMEFEAYNGIDFARTVGAGNFTTEGIYAFVITCNTSQQAGFFAGNIEVTKTGDIYESTQIGIIIAQGILIALLVALGFSFSKEKWKIRGFFFTLALLVCIISINSLRVLTGSSHLLDSMTTNAFIIGIVAVSFMAIYLLIYYTIELFKTIRNKKEMKWEVSNRFS